MTQRLRLWTDTDMLSRMTRVQPTPTSRIQCQRVRPNANPYGPTPLFRAQHQHLQPNIDISSSHPCNGWQGPRERSRAPSGEFPLCSAQYLLTTHHHYLPPHHRPWRTPTRAFLPPCATSAVSTRPRTPRTGREPAPVPLQTRPPPPRQPPPRKCNPPITTNCPWKHPQKCLKTHGNNPAPRINHPRRQSAHENAPTDGIQRWGPSMRTQCHLANQQGIQHPPCSQVRTPCLCTNQPRMTAKMPAPSATRPPLRPTHHGRLDHMLTPRCAQTRLSTVRILGGT